jgi:hypothetical protein
MTDRRLQRGIRALLALAAVALLLTAVAAATPAGSSLIVADASTGERLLATPAEAGTPVALEYTHSVEKTRVLDAYVVRDGELVMTRMEFRSSGWGLPASANVTRENGSYTFDPEGSYEELFVKPGRVADHRLHVGDRSYDLVALSEARGVRLHVAERSLLSTTLDNFRPS